MPIHTRTTQSWPQSKHYFSRSTSAIFSLHLILPSTLKSSVSQDFMCCLFLYWSGVVLLVSPNTIDSAQLSYQSHLLLHVPFYVTILFVPTSVFSVFATSASILIPTSCNRRSPIFDTTNHYDKPIYSTHQLPFSNILFLAHYSWN